MKRHLLAATATLAVACATAFAFGGPGPGQGRRGGPHGPGGPPLGQIVTRHASDLGLSDAQKTAIAQIVDEERGTFTSFMEKQRTGGDDLRTLGTDGTFDEAKVRAIAEEHAKVMVEMTVARERSKAKIFAALTPEQRTKLVDMLESFGPPRPPAE